MELSNELMEELFKLDLTGAEFRIILFLVRKTWGWNKKDDIISISKFVEGTQLSDRAIKKGLKALRDMRIVYSEPSTRVHRGSPLNGYLFNKHYDTWIKKSEQTGKGCTKRSKRVNETVRKGEQPFTHNDCTSNKNNELQAPKDILTKDTLTKDITDSPNPELSLNIPRKDKYDADINAIYEFFLKQAEKTPKQYRLTPARKIKIRARLKDGLTVKQLSQAIQAMLNSDWHKEHGLFELERHCFRSYEQTEKRINEYLAKYGPD